jgi:hypothetical protein
VHAYFEEGSIMFEWLALNNHSGYQLENKKIEGRNVQ